ncbi:hypothetical protein C8F04DRAFT_1189336 [Mycena alexandri]|uniref:Uncharacterized protein n=1 Tax=Mycena alexandri TaxID=1745969 RepID=A0AAD6WWA7_9AGAR|nr:hypothetical protein C8F04DRAFT_1189336 [Mycena alexandri]
MTYGLTSARQIPFELCSDHGGYRQSGLGVSAWSRVKLFSTFVPSTSTKIRTGSSSTRLKVSMTIPPSQTQRNVSTKLSMLNQGTYHDTGGTCFTTDRILIIQVLPFRVESSVLN